MLTRELDFDLPAELIAQAPAPERDASRLLVVHRADGRFEERGFADIGEYLREGDTLALNDTKVIRARLSGHKPTGGAIEIFLLAERAPGEWLALLKPSAKAKPGTRILLPAGLEAEAGEKLDDGKRIVRFNTPDVLPRLEEVIAHAVDADDIALTNAIHHLVPEFNGQPRTAASRRAQNH